MVEYSKPSHVYDHLSYEETCKILKEYFINHHKDFMIEFKPSPLEDVDSDMDLPDNKISLEDKFFGP